jgi:hypothetical protein
MEPTPVSHLYENDQVRIERKPRSLYVQWKGQDPPVERHIPREGLHPDHFVWHQTGSVTIRHSKAKPGTIILSVWGRGRDVVAELPTEEFRRLTRRDKSKKRAPKNPKPPKPSKMGLIMGED